MSINNKYHKEHSLVKVTIESRDSSFDSSAFRFTRNQQEQLTLGIYQGVPTRVYAYADLRARTMYIVREALVSGVNPDYFTYRFVHELDRYVRDGHEEWAKEEIKKYAAAEAIANVINLFL